MHWCLFLYKFTLIILSYVPLQNNVIDQLQAVSGMSCPYSQDDCVVSNQNQAGYLVAAGQTHNFDWFRFKREVKRDTTNISPDSLFMDVYNPWGLPQNFDWLAKEGRVKQSGDRSYDSFIPAVMTHPPTSSPTVNQSAKQEWWKFW